MTNDQNNLPPEPEEEKKLPPEPEPESSEEPQSDELLEEMAQNGEIMITDELPESKGEADKSLESEEDAIRSELGIGGASSSIDQEEIDDLLREAEVGYEKIFSEAEDDSAPQVKEKSSPLDSNLKLLRDVHMKVKVELGRGQMYLKDILQLGQGSVVELERLAGDPLDIYVNDKLVARGEVLVLNENFCIRITEIFSPAEAVMG